MIVPVIAFQISNSGAELRTANLSNWSLKFAKLSLKNKGVDSGIIIIYF